jgi:2-dehydropantoate 2-reductase
MGSADPRVLIIGAGAVGCFIGARLALAGVNVSLVGRGPLVAAARDNGLHLVEPEGERNTSPLPAFASLGEAFAAAGFDLAIVTAKAYDTEAIIAELRAATPAPPPLLSMQNGVGNEDAFSQAFGAELIIAGAIETPVTIPVPGTVTVHRSRYRTGIAPVASHSKAEFATDILRRGSLSVHLYDDYRRLKWSKLLLNLPANAQCAILDWTPAQCMATPATAALEARAWQEAFRVMTALDIRPVNLAGYPLALLGLIVPHLPAGALARGMARTVAGGRGTKMPSFHAALSSGKRSEVHWLNGAVSRYGQAAGVRTPANTALASVLSAISIAPETWRDWQDQPQKLAWTIASGL